MSTMANRYGKTEAGNKARKLAAIWAEEKRIEMEAAMAGDVALMADACFLQTIADQQRVELMFKAATTAGVRK